MINKRTAKSLIGILLVVALAAGLCGCGLSIGKGKDKGADVDALRDKLHAAQQGVSGAGEDGANDGSEGKDDQKPADDEVPAEKTPAHVDTGVVDLNITTDYKTEWREQDKILDFECENLVLGKDSADKYPELAKKVAIINDIVNTERSNSYMARMKELDGYDNDEIREAIDYYYLPFNETWKLYVRRADEEVFSVLYEYCTSGTEYYHYTHTGFNIDTKSGTELTLADVVADEDAFVQILTKKVKQTEETDIPDLATQDEAVLAEQIRKELHTEIRGNWTMDPQGVSVWFDSFTFTTMPIHINVLFAEDTDGNIFSEEYRAKAPKDWTMMFPLYRYDGYGDETGANQIYVYEAMEYEGDYNYVSGIHVDCNGNIEKYALGDDIYEIRPLLVHKENKTFLFAFYKDYDYSMIDTFILEGRKSKHGGGVAGSVSVDFDDFDDDDSAIPRHILTDPWNISLTAYTNVLSTCGSERSYTLTEDGLFAPDTPYYTILESSRYTIRPKSDMKNIPVVDEQTHEVMSTTVDLKAGDEITMEYTDDDNYADVRTKDGTLIRIEIHKSADGPRYVYTEDGPIEVWQAFDDMFFAG
ncbi:MAG: hypothetical protein J5518_01735 [Lachnospiraceae bacterium]|nr:hypothetical protein [Lachnospiraceae bacterium]